MTQEQIKQKVLECSCTDYTPVHFLHKLGDKNPPPSDMEFIIAALAENDDCGWTEEAIIEEVQRVADDRVTTLEMVNYEDVISFDHMRWGIKRTYTGEVLMIVDGNIWDSWTVTEGFKVACALFDIKAIFKEKVMHINDFMGMKPKQEVINGTLNRRNQE